jgi:hypothetical protein
VITAENAFLSARETELQVKLRQLTASVTLINDLGGGFGEIQPDDFVKMNDEDMSPRTAPGSNGSNQQ